MRSSYENMVPLGTPWVAMTGHWLAIEVLSPSSHRYDRDFKRDAYLALGVKEVWLVDIADKSVAVCRERGVETVVRDVIRWRIDASDRIVDVYLQSRFAPSCDSQLGGVNSTGA